MDRETVVRRFGKAALNAERTVELSAEAAVAAVRVTFLVPKTVTTDPLWILPDGLLLYQPKTRGVLFFSDSLLARRKVFWLT